MYIDNAVVWAQRFVTGFMYVNPENDACQSKKDTCYTPSSFFILKLSLIPLTDYLGYFFTNKILLSVFLRYRRI